MIYSARPIVTPVENIVFCCFVFLDFKSGDERTTCAKTIIPPGRDFGLAEWINFLFCFLPSMHDTLFYNLVKREIAKTVVVETVRVLRLLLIDSRRLHSDKLLISPEHKVHPCELLQNFSFAEERFFSS